MMAPGRRVVHTYAVSGIEWFWAIVCNAMVIGGAVIPGVAFGIWWMTGPHRREA